MLPINWSSSWRKAELNRGAKEPSGEGHRKKYSVLLRGCKYPLDQAGGWGGTRTMSEFLDHYSKTQEGTEVYCVLHRSIILLGQQEPALGGVGNESGGGMGVGREAVTH